MPINCSASTTRQTLEISLGTLAAIILQLEREHKLAMVSDRNKCASHLDAIFNKLQSDSQRANSGPLASVNRDQFKGIYIGIMQHQQHAASPTKQKRRNSVQFSPRDASPSNRRRIGVSPRESDNSTSGRTIQEAAT